MRVIFWATMDVGAQAEAFLLGLEQQTFSNDPSSAALNNQNPPQENAAWPPAADQYQAAQYGNGQHQEWNGQAYAQPVQDQYPPQPEQPQQQQGVQQSGNVEEGATRRKRNRWGPSADDAVAATPGTAGTAEQPGKRKRRSRWEEADETTSTALVTSVPRELVLPGGIKVSGCPFLSSA